MPSYLFFLCGECLAGTFTWREVLAGENGTLLFQLPAMLSRHSFELMVKFVDGKLVSSRYEALRHSATHELLQTRRASLLHVYPQPSFSQLGMIVVYARKLVRTCTQIDKGNILLNSIVHRMVVSSDPST